MNLAELPGGGLLRDGLRDLADGRETVPSLLLRIAAPRLREHGFAIPPAVPGAPAAELRLYTAGWNGIMAFKATPATARFWENSPAWRTPWTPSRPAAGPKNWWVGWDSNPRPTA